jgi:hypothetical protein
MTLYWYEDRWHTQRDMGLRTTEIAEYSEAQCTSRMDTVSCGYETFDAWNPSCSPVVPHAWYFIHQRRRRIVGNGASTTHLM